MGPFKSEESRKNEIIRLALAYSLASKHTSFLAIEERDDADDAPVAEKRSVPAPKPRASSGGAAVTRSQLFRHKAFQQQPPAAHSSMKVDGCHAEKKPLQSPFGVFVNPVSTGFADRYITFGLRGPRNIPEAFNCWLNAALSFIYSIPHVQDMAWNDEFKVWALWGFVSNKV